MGLFVLCVDSVCELFVLCVDSVCELFDAIYLGGGGMLDRPCMVFQRMCCACDPNVHLDVPSTGYVTYLLI